VLLPFAWGSSKIESHKSPLLYIDLEQLTLPKNLKINIFRYRFSLFEQTVWTAGFCTEVYSSCAFLRHKGKQLFTPQRLGRVGGSGFGRLPTHRQPGDEQGRCAGQYKDARINFEAEAMSESRKRLPYLK